MSRDMSVPTRDESLALRTLAIVGRRRMLAAVVFAAVLASALSFAFYLPDLYRATAIVLVDRQISESFVRPAVSGELESRLHVIKQEILSRDRLTELINRFDLYPELRSRTSFEAILDQTRRDIQVELTGPEQVSGRTKTVAFRLSYTGNARESVSNVTNAIAAFYVAQNARIRSQEAIQTTQFLKAQLNEAKKHIEQQEQSVRAYTARHVGELPSQVEVNLATLERLNMQLRLNSEQQIRLIDQRDKLTETIGTTTTVVDGRVTAVESPSPAAEKLERMRETLQQMETRFTSKHPDVARLKEDIVVAEREAAHEAAGRETTGREAAALPHVIESPNVAAASAARRRSLESVDADLEKLRKEEADLHRTIDTFEKRLEIVPERQQEFAQITRDHQAARELYDSLLKRYDEAQLVESMETDRQGERFRILEPALPPEGPVAPNRLRLILMGLILAAAAAALTVLGAEQLDTSFHSTDELRQFTKIPVLATIPRIGIEPARRRLRAAFAMASVLAALALIFALSIHVARGNEQLVRMLVRAS